LERFSKKKVTALDPLNPEILEPFEVIK